MKACHRQLTCGPYALLDRWLNLMGQVTMNKYTRIIYTWFGTQDHKIALKLQIYDKASMLRDQ